MNAQRIICGLILSGFAMLLWAPPAVAEIPADVRWIEGEWQHRRLVTVNWSFELTLDGNFFTANSEVLGGITGNVLSSRRSIIGMDPGTGRLHSWIFEDDGTVMEIDWTEFGDVWRGELSGFKENGDQIQGNATLEKVSEDEFEYRITNLTVDGHTRPDVTTSYEKQ